ncbi:MAG: imidazole glycerol phosphate synthase subunit HisH [Spirochaetales bacterium]|nr:imidazole glycerol phosphate synthase subunit HisH [Spirochaetales bacterium]
MTGVVDYNAGNLKSVETALEFLKADFFVSANPEDFKRADNLIFPGVGEARASMNILNKSGLGEAIRLFCRSGKPVLGICLGCQIIFTHSEEGDTPCLDLIPGNVPRFPKKEGFKVPHMGWNQVSHLDRHPIFTGIPENSSFYFVHSYYPEPEKNEHIIGETEYCIRFCSAVQKENLVAVQFHPEKSGKTGLILLSNFLNLT